MTRSKKPVNGGELASKIIVALCFVVLTCYSAGADGAYWERIPVSHVAPSRIFSQLGLTHTTRHGYTRGNGHGSDENFPPGMTDIIPYDPLNELLVRGTVDGVGVFRSRVLALDVRPPTYTLQFQLEAADTHAVLGTMVKPDAIMDNSETVLVSDGIENHPYRYHLYQAPGGQVSIVLRIGVLTPVTPGLSVFAPTVVWLDPVSKTTSYFVPALFTDRSADKAGVRTRLGITDDSSDYELLVSVHLNVAVSPSAVIVPPVPQSIEPKP